MRQWLIVYFSMQQEINVSKIPLSVWKAFFQEASLHPISYIRGIFTG